MAKLYNLARMATATTGTGTITLGAAISGYLTFATAGVTDGEIISYGINDGINSEIGIGTYTASGTTLTRTVTKSTNSDSPIVLSGTAQVFITPRKEDLPCLLTNGTVANSASTLDLVLVNYTSYRSLKIYLNGFRPATDGDVLWLRFSTDGGATYITTANYGYVNRIHHTGADDSNAANGQSQITLASTNGSAGVGNVTTEGGDWEVWMYNRTDAAKFTRVRTIGNYHSNAGTSQLTNFNGSGTYEVAQDTDAVRFLWSTGNFASSSPGTYAIYGIP